jgi:hypothetical protein
MTTKLESGGASVTNAETILFIHNSRERQRYFIVCMYQYTMWGLVPFLLNLKNREGCPQAPLLQNMSCNSTKCFGVCFMEF